VQVSRPPVRRVVISRRYDGAGYTWQVIGNVSGDAVAFLDTDVKHPPDKVHYEVTNWSTYGRHALSAILFPPFSVLQLAHENDAKSENHFSFNLSSNWVHTQYLQKHICTLSGQMLRSQDLLLLVHPRKPLRPQQRARLFMEASSLLMLQKALISLRCGTHQPETHQCTIQRLPKQS
jgi:hypothetical protein